MKRRKREPMTDMEGVGAAFIMLLVAMLLLVCTMLAQGVCERWLDGCWGWV